MWITFVCILTILFVESKAISGKAFLCRDPDTGKLYTVNSTWPSTTFCGNYHCKLRKKNVTEHELEPLRQINLTNNDIQSNVPKLYLILNKDTLIQNHKNVESIRLNRIEDPNTLKISPDNAGLIKSLEGDRYLTDNEIKTISSILHTVKKSDLEAIVEIYQLAQNIYDEIDKTNPETLIQETVNDLKQNTPAKVKSKLLNAADTKRVSYFYDPINNNKHISHVKELPMTVVKVKPEVKILRTEPVKHTTTSKPIKLPVAPTNAVNYFDGPLTTRDFGRLPYYFPLSSFQRVSSYLHQPLVISNTPYPRQITTTKIPETRTTTKTPITKYQKDIKPSIYLPYPFFNVPHNYNWTFPQTTYHSKNYVDRYEMSLDNNKRKNNAILINPDLENVQELRLKSVEKQERSLPKMIALDKNGKEKHPVHDWQTNPISKTILEEVRAHIDKTKFMKPLSLRKKIKLDRVAKVIKVDEFNMRPKRSPNVKNEIKDFELYEVYLDTTICQSNDTVPGFFKYGNLSQPFPECCPQRIQN